MIHYRKLDEVIGSCCTMMFETLIRGEFIAAYTARRRKKYEESF